MKNMNGLKKFKVFYFLDSDHQGIDETRKVELIMARSEDDAERWFKLMYNKSLSDGTISFGWVEEVMPSE